MLAEALLCSEVRLSWQSSAMLGMSSRNLSETRENNFRGCVANSVLDVRGIKLPMRQLLQPINKASGSLKSIRHRSKVEHSHKNLCITFCISQGQNNKPSGIFFQVPEIVTFTIKSEDCLPPGKGDGNLLRLFIEMGICFQKMTVHLLNSASYLLSFSAYRHVLCPYTVAAASH